MYNNPNIFKRPLPVILWIAKKMVSLMDAGNHREEDVKINKYMLCPHLFIIIVFIY